MIRTVRDFWPSVTVGFHYHVSRFWKESRIVLDSQIGLNYLHYASLSEDFSSTALLAEIGINNSQSQAFNCEIFKLTKSFVLERCSCHSLGFLSYIRCFCLSTQLEYFFPSAISYVAVRVGRNSSSVDCIFFQRVFFSTNCYFLFYLVYSYIYDEDM